MGCCAVVACRADKWESLWAAVAGCRHGRQYRVMRDEIGAGGRCRIHGDSMRCCRRL